MAERPVECSHCKRPIKVIYKEIVDDNILVTETCAECPILQQKLHGQPYLEKIPEGLSEKEAGLCCGQCGTTMAAVQTGNPLGCSECYAVFSDLLIDELTHSNKISSRLQKSLEAKKTQPIHVGKSPTQPVNVALSSRLSSLNEALNEAIKRENYEQAAMLRDQIKALMEKTDEGKN